eukprot:scaffold71990_cov65-Phaeocystis_antarctica.AAC.6
MVTPSTTSAVQVHEPRHWPRTVSSMRWTSTRPIRPSAVQNAATLSRGHSSVGTESDVQMEIARLRAIRKAWHGKAIRKSCAAQADSCEGFAKAPVTGCIAMLAAAASSGSCSLRGAPLESSVAAGSIAMLAVAASRSGSSTLRGASPESIVAGSRRGMQGWGL